MTIVLAMPITLTATCHGYTYHGYMYHGYTYHGDTYHGSTYHGATYHGATYHGATYQVLVQPLSDRSVRCCYCCHIDIRAPLPRPVLRLATQHVVTTILTMTILTMTMLL